MLLTAGETLSHYVILDSLGVGGMGEVYRAKDTRLEREVAVKVLARELTYDEERLRRFEREAKLLASLNHPNVAAIYGIDQVDDVCFLALELVPGENLDDRIKRGPIAVREALEICRQIADGLEAAHEAGIIHRDLKPANVRITPEGVVKVLDFGLAKASGSRGEALPVDSVEVTQPGMLFGTPAYMSPEQVHGDPVDRRIDIWAFGCVLWETLTGQRLFDGESLGEVLLAGSIREPDWKLLPQATPKSIEVLIRRCLRREPLKRLRDIGDARIEIEEALDAPIYAPEPKSRRRRRSHAGSRLVGAFSIVVAAVLGFLASKLYDFGDEPPTPRHVWAVADGFELRPEARPCVSPDGGRVAYFDGKLLAAVSFADEQELALAETAGASHPFWSPDSRQLGFMLDWQLYTVPVEGGRATVVASVGEAVAPRGGAAWESDGAIVFTAGQVGSPLRRVRPGERPEDVLTERNAAIGQPVALPDDRGVVVVVYREDAVELALLDGGELRTLLAFEDEMVDGPAFSPTGHLLFWRSGTDLPGIWAVALTGAGTVAGAPFSVVPGGCQPSVADDGTLVYAVGDPLRSTQLVWIDRDGTVLEEIGSPRRGIRSPALAPFDRQVAVSAFDEGRREIWVHTVDGEEVRLTSGPGERAFPAWSPRGSGVAYVEVGNPDRIMMRDVEGSSSAAKLLDGGSSPGFSHERSVLFFTRQGPGTGSDIWVWAYGVDESAPSPYLAGHAEESMPRPSADDQALAFVSDKSGRSEVYVGPFPPRADMTLLQVSAQGGTYPRWSPLGKELFYVEGDALLVVDVRTSPTIEVGAPREVFTEAQTGIDLSRGYDVALDGRRIVAVRGSSSAPRGQVSGRLAVITDWSPEERP